MRELLYEAAKHYRQGRMLAEQGDAKGAGEAYEAALRELQAVKPQRMRDVLLAQVYLSRHQLDVRAPDAASDLRLGYTYARTTCEANVRQLAETLWREAVAEGRHLAPARGARRPRPNPPKGDVGERHPGAERRPASARAGDGGPRGAAGERGRGAERRPERAGERAGDRRPERERGAARERGAVGERRADPARGGEPREGKGRRPGRPSTPRGPEGSVERPGDERAD